MTTLRDALVNLRPLEIPRPHVSNLQFIPTRGRFGFYKSIRKQGAEYGISIKSLAPRRTPLNQAYWYDTTKWREETNEEIENTVKSDQAESTNCEQAEQSLTDSTPSYMNVSSSPPSVPTSSSNSKKQLNIVINHEPIYPDPDYDSDSQNFTEKLS